MNADEDKKGADNNKDDSPSKSYSASKKTNPSKHKNNKSKYQTYATKIYRTIVDYIFPKRSANYRIMVFTGVIAFANIILLIFMGIQISDNRTQMAYTDSLSNHSIELTKNISLFNDTIARMEARGYIVAPFFSFDPNSKVLTVRIQNEGKTGAYRVKYFISGYANNSELIADSINWYNRYMNGDGVDIGMGDNEKIKTFINISGGCCDTLFAYGYIIYEDAFRQPHKMRFFERLDYYWETPIDKQDWLVCKKYNDQDH